MPSQVSKQSYSSTGCDQAEKRKLLTRLSWDAGRVRSGPLDESEEAGQEARAGLTEEEGTRVGRRHVGEVGKEGDRGHAVDHSEGKGEHKEAQAVAVETLRRWVAKHLVGWQSWDKDNGLKGG